MHKDAFTFLRDLVAEETVYVRVRGDCMAGVIRDGARIAVQERFAFPGDVLVFRRPSGDIAAHRFLGWRGTSLLTKGDLADVHDSPVRRNDVLGVAVVTVSLADRISAIEEWFRIAWRRLTR